MGPSRASAATGPPADRGAPGFVTTVEHRERGIVIRPRGVLDVRTAAALRDAVTTAVDATSPPPATVVVDLAAVTAGDDLGLWVLPAMAGDLERAGGSLVIAVPTRRLRVRLRRLGARPLEITDSAPDVGVRREPG